ncbi:class I SAM-dependent methyltransferase [Bacillus toyonensis]|uniref:class I SAM-dependent methyltransferase n=1 Tax=Bacillus toyonensis TaxID=155322 RepID=UPI0033956E4C
MSYKKSFEDFNRAVNEAAAERWKDSANICTEWLLSTIQSAPNKDKALIIGAGAANDFFLHKIVEKFDQVVLLDIDEHAVDLAISKLSEDLKIKVVKEIVDITCIGSDIEEVILFLKGDNSLEEKRTRVRGIRNNLSKSFKIKSLGEFSWVFSDCISTQMLSPLFKEVSVVYENNPHFDSSLLKEYIDLNLALFAEYVKFLSKLLCKNGKLAFASDVITLNEESVLEIENILKRSVNEIASNPRVITGLTNRVPNYTIAGWYIDSILKRNPKIKLAVLPTNMKSWLWSFNEEKQYLVIGKELKRK